MGALIATALSSIFAGGATGLLGMGLQRLFDWLKVKQDMQLQKIKNEHELAMRDKDAAIMDKEWQGRLRVATQEGDTAKDVAASQAFAQTLLREPERYSNASTLTPRQQWVMVILDFCRGIIRPLLTVYLCVLTSYIWWEVHSKLALEDLDGGQALDIWTQVVNTILYLTTTVVLWWFGTRNQMSRIGGPSSK